jgi:hypothetical protein
MSEEAKVRVSGAQEDFIEEKARELLVSWAEHQVRLGTLNQAVLLVEPYLSAAVGKGWISVKGGTPKVLAKGFSAAAAYLRR